MPTTNNDPRYDSGTDVFVAAFVIIAAVLLFPISLFFLVRELLGTSARAKQAGLLVTRLREVSASPLQ